MHDKHQNNKHTVSDRLMQRLSRDHGLAIPPGTTIHRTYAGRLQRQTDAWSWFAIDLNGRIVCASQYPVSLLVRSSKIAVTFDSVVSGTYIVDVINS